MVARKKRGSRGSALLAIAYLGVVLTGVVGIYFYRTSQAASTESQVRENVDGAQTVATYAADLAITNLTDMRYVLNSDGTKKVSILADWVGSNKYGTGPESAERRIGGTIGDYEYRVLVRAVREAKSEGGMSSAWLSNVNPPHYDYGNDPVRSFSGAYEIIASARNRSASSNPTLTYDSSVRTVVNLSFNSLANFQEQLAVWHQNNPSGLTGDVIGPYISANLSDQPSNKLQIAGEDHYAVKASYVEPTDEEVIEGLASMRATPSELYSVTNDFWSQGKMTLHYRNGDDYNPMIPRTIGFDDTGVGVGTRGLNQQMVVYNPSQPVDQYVFGGKIAQSDFTLYDPNTSASLMYRRGRSVTLDANNNINETRESHSHPGAMTTSTLVVGKVENILKLYMNFVNPLNDANHPAKNATESQIRTWVQTRWSQQSLGYYTRNSTKNMCSSVGRAQRPLDNANSSRRRRWATLLWIKNSDGQFLVRDYHGDYSLPNKSRSTPEDSWNGTYRWAWYGGYLGSEKYHFGSWKNPKTIAIGNSSNYRKYLNTRFLTIEELLGVKVTKSTMDNLPAKLDGSGVVVGGVPDILRDVNGVPYAFDPDGSGTVFDERGQRSTLGGDNWGVNSSTLSTMPPTDGIYVLQEDPSAEYDWTYAGKRYKRYKTLKDFAFDRDIADVGEDPDIRSMTSFHMVLEITPEQDSSTGEGMYFDMGLTVTLVHPKKITMVDRGDDFLEEFFKQWWQGDRIETLTGNTSHTSVSSLPRKPPEGTPEDEILKAYFEQFGFFREGPYSGNYDLQITGIDTMVDDNRAKTVFGRAKFDSAGVVQPNSHAHDGIFYYGRDDLHALYDAYREEFSVDKFEEDMKTNGIWETVKEDPDFNTLLANWREEKGVNMWKSLSDIHPTFKPLTERFDVDHREQSFFELDTMKELFKVPEDDITTRFFAAQALGFKNQRVPVAYAKRVNIDPVDPTKYDLVWTERFSDLNPGGTDSDTPIVKKTIPFIPGERVLGDEDGFVPAPTASDPFVPMLYRDNGTKQYNGRPLKPTFVWPTGGAAGELNLASIHNWPKWFTDPSEGVVTRDLKEVLLGEKLYPTEHRGGIGWHREGPKPQVDSEITIITPEEYKLMFGDNYEYTLITERGFIPYRTVRAKDGQIYVAAVRPDTVTPVELDDCEPQLKHPDEMPTFVISGRELDGAGMLIVNGNLHLKTTLAFHGTVVVLGNLTVTPEKYQRTNADGQPMDKDGNLLSWDGSHWYYLDENNAKQISYTIDEWRGSLTVQGKIMVGGKVSIAAGNDTNPDNITPAGKIDVRGSKQAVDETTNLWLEVAPNEGFNSDRLGWSTGAGTSVGYDLWQE